MKTGYEHAGNIDQKDFRMDGLTGAAGRTRPSEGQSPQQGASAIPVLYVAGYGRSGSTVVDISLGQHPDIFGAGEVGNLFRHVWPENEYCACGLRVRSCPIWGQIVAQWLDGQDPDLPARYRAQTIRFEAVLSPLFRPKSWAQDPGFQEYARHTARLFAAIRDVTGARVIVDSSKLPSRARALSLIPQIDLRIVHLVRDGRGVAWSMMQAIPLDVSAGVQKQIDGKSAGRTSIRWSAFNLMTEYVCSRLPAGRSRRITYEDFTARPRDTLDSVGALVDADFAAAFGQHGDGRDIVPNHQVAGSRIRLKGPLRVSRDASWEGKMPARDQRRVEIAAGWLMRRYGYV